MDTDVAYLIFIGREMFIIILFSCCKNTLG